MFANDRPSLARTAWITVALLFPVALLNYLDRQMVASMKVSVMHDIPGFASEAHWGSMLAWFKWVYAFCSPIGGYVADRFSHKWTICLSLFIWSAITYLTGHVDTYHGMVWTRAAMGISEACYIPAALALIADFHIGNTRSRAVGIHQMGIYCGIIVGGFAGFVADDPTWGWRSAFNMTGLAGVLYSVPLLLFLKEAPRSASPAAAIADRKPGVYSALSELWTNPSYILLVLYFTLPAIAAWVVRDWMPAILQNEFNISQGNAGVSAALYWQAAAVVSAIAGGWLADRWMRRSPRGRIYVSAIGMAIIVPALFSVGNAPSQNSFALAIFGLILFGIGWGFFDGNNMPILCQIVRPHLRATGYGLMNLVSMVTGGIADHGFGMIRDAKVPLNLVFGGFAAICILSGLLVLLIRPSMELAREPVAGGMKEDGRGEAQ